MKKIALFAVAIMFLAGAIAPAVMAQTATSTTSTTPGKKPAAPQFNAACMKTAVSARETALIASHQSFSSTVQAALQARLTAMNAAWDKTEQKEIRKALNEAEKTYRNSVRAGEKKHKGERHAAWSKFVKERKACGGNEIDRSSEGKD